MTGNWPVYGHDWAVDYLRRGLANARVRHAYLITGMDSTGKDTLAHAFAMALNCEEPDVKDRPCFQCRSCKKIMSGNHSDMIYSETDPTTGALRIEAVRSVTSRLAMKPYEGRYRVAIMRDFQRARPQAQDALLKTLEEPAPHAVLILLASSLESILPTIISRSQVISLRPVAFHVVHDVLTTHYEVSEDEAQEIARFSGGRIGWAIRAAQEPDLLTQRAEALDMLEEAIRGDRRGRFDLAAGLGRDKSALYPLLELWLTFWRDMLLYIEGSSVKLSNIDRTVSIEQLSYDLMPEDVLKALEATRDMLDNLDTNANLRLALEAMFLDYPAPSV